MLIVSIHRHVGRSNPESRRRALSIEPFEALFLNGGDALDGSLSIFTGPQRVHYHIMLDRTAARVMTAADDRIGAQRKTEPISGLEGWRERLRLVDLEQPMAIFRKTCGKDEKYTRAHLAPQKITCPVGAVGEEGPHESGPPLAIESESYTCVRINRFAYLRPVRDGTETTVEIA